MSDMRCPKCDGLGLADCPFGGPAGPCPDCQPLLPTDCEVAETVCEQYADDTTLSDRERCQWFVLRTILRLLAEKAQAG